MNTPTVVIALLGAHMCATSAWGAEPERAMQSESSHLTRGVPPPLSALDPGWVRVGSLGPVPVRTNESFPLSDQTNRGDWQRIENLWDEFSGPRPDAAKWWLTNHTWAGRPPFAFDAANVSVSDGNLVLRATAELTGKAAANLPDGFTHTAAFVRSKEAFLYGYVEIRAQLAATSVNSCFFLMDSTAEASTEIDVFEIAAADPSAGRRMGMTRHVLKLPGYTPAPGKHLWHTEAWVAPFNFGDAYHVYAVEWDAEMIGWYVDGVLVHRAANSAHRFPLRIILDLEPNQSYQANAMESLLPATFRVDYVRAWNHRSALPR